MLILISPAKTLDFTTPSPISHFSCPEFVQDSNFLVDQLRQLSASEISSLMKISPKLGDLNAGRYQAWQNSANEINAKQAIFAFQGDVYQGLDVSSFRHQDLDFAQEHLRILSGLYGLLRPLDLIQPYRLEMGTKLVHGKLNDISANNLYDFWQDKLTRAINQQLTEISSQILLNLASNEYFKAVNTKLLEAEIITPVFKDWKNGKYKIISFYAKKARGMMAAYMIENQLTEIEELKNFDRNGYSYCPEMSNAQTLVFIRE